MLNKIFKTIHNKYYKIFKFIFFLRYLFAIFLISIAIFLSIPFLFDYNNKAEIIKGHLSQKYNFELKKFEEISFEVFPTPSLNIKDAEIYFKFSSANLIFELKLFSKSIVALIPDFINLKFIYLILLSVCILNSLLKIFPLIEFLL